MENNDENEKDLINRMILTVAFLSAIILLVHAIIKLSNY